jgi:hypothetical protein
MDPVWIWVDIIVLSAVISVYLLTMKSGIK